MNYKENTLCYEEYCKLRESVGWINFSRTQTEKSLQNSLYTVAIFFEIFQSELTGNEK